MDRYPWSAPFGPIGGHLFAGLSAGFRLIPPGAYGDQGIAAKQRAAITGHSARAKVPEPWGNFLASGVTSNYRLCSTVRQRAEVKMAASQNHQVKVTGGTQLHHAKGHD